MRQPKPRTMYWTRGKDGTRVRVPLLDTASKTAASDAVRPFIPPPTREQLMAGSASLRRVYKIDG
jgi:hypothetical protein